VLGRLDNDKSEGATPIRVECGIRIKSKKGNEQPRVPIEREDIKRALSKEG
jgi:hypothetical protein